MPNNYQELIDDILDEIVRPELGPQAVKWIAQAEKYLSREITLTDGEQVLSASTVPSQDYIELPPGFKRPIHFEFQTSPLRVLNQVTWTKLSDVRENDTSGTPRALVYSGRRAYLAPAPVGAIPYELVYYGTPPPLSNTNPNSDLLEMGGDVLRYKALTYSAPYIGDDERIATWNAFVADSLPGLKREYWQSQVGGGIVRIRPDTMTRDSHF